ncbi:unnamed protein product [Paramecium primaurelia]|uniref:Tyrosyl-tRNA synthetase n=1 Tax=Paramecium primaurelia TaxID=5886 RepID=A0A8S1MB45_PARPR|nr:unnamed protein product [Paramecium primaurelia]
MFTRKLLYQATAPSIPISGSVYCGFDPTAHSLHLGNFVSILNLARLAQIGFKPIAIVGGATVQLGDPSFKMEERKEPDLVVIQENLQKIRNQLESVYGNIANHGKIGQPLQILDNMDFYRETKLIDFVSKVGRQFRMNSLLNKDHINKRLNSGDDGLSLTEFFYTILQSYDFAYLNEKYNCTLQIGGSDQWGNITNGCDFVKKQYKKQVYGITTPLLIDKNGQKFGKSEGNALFLDVSSKHNMKQYLLNLADDSIKDFLLMLTFLKEDQINSIMEQHKQNPEKRIAQKCLNDELMKMIYGEENSAEKNQILYGLKRDRLLNMSAAEFEKLAEEIDKDVVIRVSKQTALIEVLLKIRSSKSEIRRLLQQGGILINDQKVDQLDQAQLLHDKYMLLRIGKRDVRLLIFI